jgi:hypothetical protein
MVYTILYIQWYIPWGIYHHIFCDIYNGIYHGICHMVYITVYVMVYIILVWYIPWYTSWYIPYGIYHGIYHMVFTIGCMVYTSWKWYIPWRNLPDGQSQSAVQGLAFLLLSWIYEWMNEFSSKYPLLLESCLNHSYSYHYSGFHIHFSLEPQGRGCTHCTLCAIEHELVCEHNSIVPATHKSFHGLTRRKTAFHSREASGFGPFREARRMAASRLFHSLGWKSSQIAERGWSLIDLVPRDSVIFPGRHCPMSSSYQTHPSLSRRSSAALRVCNVILSSSVCLWAAEFVCKHCLQL